MKVEFNNCFGTLRLESRIRSIFDPSVAGQIATDGAYYCIHIDHSTGESYAVSKEVELTMMSSGRQLAEGEVAVFFDESVRGMTFEESRLYEEECLGIPVDLWGNIALDVRK